MPPALSCTLQPIAHARLQIAGRLPVVAARIHGHQVRLVVDTGAARSLLSPAAAKRLGVRRDPWVGEHVIGVGGGASYVWNAVTGAVEIGGVALPEPEMAVAPLAVPADGLLGADFWRRFDADLDLPHRRLTLYRASPCRRAEAPWHGPAVLLQALSNAPPDRLFLAASLDGVPATALFDTGAETGAVSLRLASRLPPPSGGWHVVHVSGVNATRRAVPARRFAKLRVGALSLAGVVMPVLPFLPGKANLVVGENLLRGCRIWFSFRARQVFVAVIPGNVLSCQPGS